VRPAPYSLKHPSTLLGVSISSTALSSTSLSIISLWILSSLSSAVASGIVLLDRLSLRLNIAWAKVAFFPAIWASTWQLVSHASPVGHLVTWSPVTGIASYEWVRPLFGAWEINWFVGAYAIVVAELVGARFIGPVEDFEPLPFRLRVDAPGRRVGHSSSYLA
jgi:hypothetical protein